MEIVLIIVLAFAVLGMTYLYNKVRVELQTVKRSDFMMRAFLRNYSHEVHSPLKMIKPRKCLFYRVLRGAPDRT